MSETRQVEWLEDPCVKIGKQCFYPGDRSTLIKSEADQYIAAGLCKCVKTGETGERKPGHVKLHVDDTYMAMQ